MHDHDGSGCIDCKCQASPMNIWPCTCPRDQRPQNREMVDGTPIEQTPLLNSNFKDSQMGEMTKVRSGSGYCFTVHIYDDWTDLIENCDFALSIFPRPGYSVRPNYPTDETHIIRGEG